MKKLIAMVLALAMILGLAACGGETPSTPANQPSDPGTNSQPAEKTYKDTIVVGTAVDQILHPWLTTDATNSQASMQITEGLVEQMDDGTLRMVLAEDVRFTDDYHIHITLRKGVKFHNGEEMKAEDVAFFFDNLEVLSTLLSKLAFVDRENIVIEDDYNLTIPLNRTYAEGLTSMSMIKVVPKKAYLEMGEDAFGNAPIGTGPYKFVSWTAGSEIRLEANEDYWGGKVQTKNLVYKIIPEASSRLVELETGGVDFITTPGTANYSRIESTEGMHLEIGPSARYVLLTFCMTDPLLSSDKRIREALLYAIDRATLVEACYEGYAYLMNTLWPTNLFGAKDLGDNPYPYDLEKAKQLMADAGYPNGFKLDLQVVGDEEKLVCEAIANMWSKLGVEANIIQMSWVNYEAAGNKYQAAVRTGAATNLTNCIIIYKTSFGRTLQVNDEWLDTNVQLSDTLTKESERQAVLNEIQDHLYEIKYCMPLANTPMAYAATDKMEGFEFRGYGVPYFWTVKIAE